MKLKRKNKAADKEEAGTENAEDDEELIVDPSLKEDIVEVEKVLEELTTSDKNLKKHRCQNSQSHRQGVAGFDHSPSYQIQYECTRSLC